MLQRLNFSFNAIISFFGSKNILHVSVMILILKLIIGYTFANILFPNETSGYQFESATEELFIAVIAAPLLETAIFQSFIIQTILKRYSEGYLLAAFTSAVLFSAAHHYSLPYITYAFIGGILFAFLYLVAQRKKYSPFWVVCICHSAFNFIGWLFDNI